MICIMDENGDLKIYPETPVEAYALKMKYRPENQAISNPVVCGIDESRRLGYCDRAEKEVMRIN